MGPLLTPMITLKHYMKRGFCGIFSTIGLSLRYAGIGMIMSGSSRGATIWVSTFVKPGYCSLCEEDYHGTSTFSLKGG